MSATITPAPTRERCPLAALLLATLISLAGSMLTFVAIPWFVLATTGSAVRAGLTGFSEALPYFVGGLLGGALVDRLGARRVAIVADLAGGAAMALIPLLYGTVGLAFWELQLLVFSGGLLTIPGATARAALVPDLTGRAGVALERVNAATQATERGARLLGAPLAGLLIAVLGPAAVLWLDAGTFALSALLIGALVPVALGAARTDDRTRPDGAGLGAELRAGWRSLRDDRLLLALALTIALTNALDTPFAGLLLPFYAQETLGSSVTLGLLLAAGGGGSLAGALLYGLWGPRLPRRPLFLLAFALTALPFVALALDPALPLLLLARFVGGVAAGPINPLIDTLKQERVAPALRGRVFGLIAAVAWAAIPLGLLASGVLLEQFGLRATALLLAGAYLATVAAMALLPALRDLRAPPPSRVRAAAASLGDGAQRSARAGAGDSRDT